jgi:HrpA-like RNA helicase
LPSNSFLAKAVNPPSALALHNSLKRLKGLGTVEVDWKGHDNGRNDNAIASQKDAAGQKDQSCGAVLVESDLTALGFHLATLPVDPRVGKMMIYVVATSDAAAQ